MKFTLNRMNERRPLTQEVTISADSSEQPRNINGEMFQRLHVLEIKVAYSFWSNEAQLPQKSALAEKAARSVLFQEMLPIVDQIIAETNEQEVFEMAILLKERMIGESDDRPSV